MHSADMHELLVCFSAKLNTRRPHVFAGKSKERLRCDPTSDPEAVRNFLHGDRAPDGATQYGVSMARWDTVDEETVKRADDLTRCAAQKGFRTPDHVLLMVDYSGCSGSVLQPLQHVPKQLKDHIGGVHVQKRASQEAGAR
jgi:hypothetical protein